MDADQRRTVDRRLRPRTLPDATPVGARIRPGHAAVVLNLCADGVLVDTAYRLRPGTIIDLVIETPSYRAQVRALVVHARVSELTLDRIRYAAGLAFERVLHGLTSSFEPVADEQWEDAQDVGAASVSLPR